MTKYEVLLNDLKEIVETVPTINKVSHGKHEPLTSESAFNAVYIVPKVDTFETAIGGTGMSSYDNYFIIQLIANIDSSASDLAWVNVRTDLIQAVLSDTSIWTNVIDRDIISVTNDNFASHPNKTINLVFEFRLREACPV